jgi:hypothetical protein
MILIGLLLAVFGYWLTRRRPTPPPERYEPPSFYDNRSVTINYFPDR